METEPLKSLGINMSVANLEAYALTKGIKKSWKEMNQAEQTTLRYNYLMEKTSKVQGDFAKTGDSFANRLRKLSGEWDNLKMAIGEKLLPIAEKALDFFIRFKNKIQDIPGIGKMAAGLAGLAVVLGPLLIAFGSLVTILGAVIAVIGAVGAPVFIAIAAISAWVVGLTALGIGLLAVMAKTGLLKKAFDLIKNSIVFLVQIIKGDTMGAFNTLTQKLGISEGQAALFIRKINEGKKALKKIIAVIKDTARLILTIFSGDKQQIINLLIKKFGMSRKEAQKFAADVKKLRKTAIDLGNKIKDFLINIFNKMITVVIKVSKFIVAHRKEIAKLIQFLVKLVTGITKSITAFVMLGTKATNAGSAIVKFLIRYIKDTITVLKLLGSAAISAGGKLISGIVNKAKSVSSALKSLKNTASNVFNSIKTAIGGAISKLGSLISKIGSVISKIKSIVFPSPPSWLPGFAKGVTNFSGGLAVVGEKGPEIVKLPRGSDVIPNNRIGDFAQSLKDKIAYSAKSEGNVTTVSLNMYNNISKDVDIDNFMNKVTQRLKSLKVLSNG